MQVGYPWVMLTWTVPLFVWESFLYDYTYLIIDEFQINEINVDLRTSGFDNEVLSVDACAVWRERESFYCLLRIGVSVSMRKCADWVNLKFVYRVNMLVEWGIQIKIKLALGHNKLRNREHYRHENFIYC